MSLKRIRKVFQCAAPETAIDFHLDVEAVPREQTSDMGNGPTSLQNEGSDYHTGDIVIDVSLMVTVVNGRHI